MFKKKSDTPSPKFVFDDPTSTYGCHLIILDPKKRGAFERKLAEYRDRPTDLDTRLRISLIEELLRNDQVSPWKVMLQMGLNGLPETIFRGDPQRYKMAKDAVGVIATYASDGSFGVVRGGRGFK